VAYVRCGNRRASVCPSCSHEYNGGDQARRLRFGAQVDARPVTGQADRETHGAQLHPETVAAYIAKYATKAAADLPTDRDGGNGHLRRLQ
jgi:hypothetical protein